MQDQNQERFAPVLFLPSLSADEFTTITNVTAEEATAFVAFFDTQVEAKRKLKHNTDGTGELLEEFKGNLNLEALVEDETLSDLIEVLSVSTIVGQRGRRAVFLDIENDTIAVGTTVIYNQNWAMRGVTDPSILTTVLEAVAAAV